MASAIPIPINYIYVIVGLILLLLMGNIVQIMGARDLPSPGMIKKAKKKKSPIVCFHFTNNLCKYVLPQPDRKPKIGKLDQGPKVNYYRAEGLLKFWDSTSKNYELIDGIVPCYHITMNMTEAQSVYAASLLSALDQELRKMNMPLDGIQDLFFYVLNEVDRAEHSNNPDGVPKQRDGIMNEVLKYVHVDDESSKERVKFIVNYVMDHKDEVNRRISRPIQHSFDTLLRSWDSLMGFTSYHADQLKICAEEAVLADQDRKGLPDIAWFAIAICGILVVSFFVAKSAHWI